MVGRIDLRIFEDILRVTGFVTAKESDVIGIACCLKIATECECEHRRQHRLDWIFHFCLLFRLCDVH